MAKADRIQIMMAGIAAWTELEASVSQLVSATLRNDAEAADAARVRSHDLLDQHLDLKIESISAIRLDVEKRSREI